MRLFRDLCPLRFFWGFMLKCAIFLWFFFAEINVFSRDLLSKFAFYLATFCRNSRILWQNLLFSYYLWTKFSSFARSSAKIHYFIETYFAFFCEFLKEFAFFSYYLKYWYFSAILCENPLFSLGSLTEFAFSPLYLNVCRIFSVIPG